MCLLKPDNLTITSWPEDGAAEQGLSRTQCGTIALQWYCFHRGKVSLRQQYLPDQSVA